MTKPLKMYFFIVNGNSVDAVVGYCLEDAIDTMSLNHPTSTSVFYSRSVEYKEMVEKVSEKYDVSPSQPQPQPQPQPLQVQVGTTSLQIKNKKKTADFLKTVMDQYGNKYVGTIIKELSYAK